VQQRTASVTPRIVTWTLLVLLALGRGARGDTRAEREAIRSAVTAERYADALELVDRATTRLFHGRARRTLPRLAELAQWRALIASGRDEPEAAVAWFRAALTFDPAWSLDEALASPGRLRLVREARRPPAASGWLRVISDRGARLQLDGDPARMIAGPRAVAVGHHRVVISRPGHISHAELVEIAADRTTRIIVALDREPVLEPELPGHEPVAERRWYQRWYVWTGLGMIAGVAMTRMFATP
jgi:hypothetical protein